MKEIIPGNVKNVTKYGQRGLKYKKDNMYIQRSLIHNPIGLQKQEEYRKLCPDTMQSVFTRRSLNAMCVYRLYRHTPLWCTPLNSAEICIRLEGLFKHSVRSIIQCSGNNKAMDLVPPHQLTHYKMKVPLHSLL